MIYSTHIAKSYLTPYPLLMSHQKKYNPTFVHLEWTNSYPLPT